MSVLAASSFLSQSNRPISNKQLLEVLRQCMCSCGYTCLGVGGTGVPTYGPFEISVAEFPNFLAVDQVPLGNLKRAG